MADSVAAREEAIRLLQETRSSLAAPGIKTVGLFGSFAPGSGARNGPTQADPSPCFRIWLASSFTSSCCSSAIRRRA